MGSVHTSIELAKASWAMIRQDKELLALPVLSGVSSLVVVALFAIPVFASMGLDSFDGGVSADAGPLTYVLSAALYLVLAFITVFFNSALVCGANERMNGGDPTLRSAIAGATSRIGRILPWAVVSATVSFVIRQIQERAGVLGSVLGFLGGLAWAAVTFLVLPILVIEDVGVGDAVKRSAALLRQVWGQGLAGHIGMGLVGFVAAAPFLILAVIGFGSGSAVVTVPLVTIAVLGLIAVAVVMSALSVVFQTALYRYAVGQPVSAYQPELLGNAFRTKRGR